MNHLSRFEEFNEGWKSIVASALLGLTTACQKVDLKDEFGNNLPNALNDVAKVTFVDSLSSDKFRIEARLSDNRIIYFDNPIKFDTGQTIYLHNDPIGRVLATTVSDDFKIPESQTIELKLNQHGRITEIGRGSKVKINKSAEETLLKNLKELRAKTKSKYISTQIDVNGNILESKPLRSLKGVKPQQNFVILKGLS